MEGRVGVVGDWVILGIWGGSYGQRLVLARRAVEGTYVVQEILCM